MSKLMNNLLHADVWAERWKGEEAKCADCGKIENQEHVFLCQHDGRKEQQQDSREPLRGMSRKHGTARELSNVLTVCLKRWEQHPNENIKPEDALAKTNGEMKPFRRNDKFSDEICMVVQNQNDIGWGNVIKGRTSKHWSKVQETCCRHMKEEEKHNGKTWGAQPVRTLWMCSESTWMHRNECKHGAGSEALDKQTKGTTAANG